MTKRSAKREIVGMGTITAKYQITLPKIARERLKIKEGDLIIFVFYDGKCVLQKNTQV